MPELSHLNPLSRAVLLAFALLLFGLLFRELVTLLVAVLATVLIAIPLSAVATRLERHRVPRWLGALLALLLGLAVISGVLALIIPPLVDQAERFVDQVPAIVDSLQQRAHDLGGADAGLRLQEYLRGWSDDPGELVGPIASIGLSVASVVGALLLMLITAYYMAVRPDPLIDGALALFPPERRNWARRLMERLRTAWVGWMQGVLADMLITGVLLYVGLRLIGLDYAILFAVLSALLVVVPYFGSIAGAIPPTLLALTDSPEKALLALGVYVLVQQVESNLTMPVVMANRVKLHPAVVAIGVIVIGQLFGLVGLFVSVPILCLIVILVDELWVQPMHRERGVRPVETVTAADGGAASLASQERPASGISTG